MAQAGAVWFVSDLHLDADQPALWDLFQQLLERVQQESAAGLYILGDLFERWIGDDDDEPLPAAVAARLTALAQSGTPVWFVHGNRDFLIGSDFARRAGMELLPETVVIDLFGTPTLLMHGDTLCTADVRYLAFRAQARDPRWQSQMLSLPLAVRRAKAAELRAASKEHQRQQAGDIIDADPQAAEASMQQYAVSQLIHGHTHRPAVHPHGNGRRIVLGDWGALPAFARFTAAGGELVFQGRSLELPRLTAVR